MNRELPTVARWLLDRFGIPQRNESLMGDLVEEYGSGRSALWFWRQAAIAIMATIARDVRNHKLLALRAIALGWSLELAPGKALIMVAANVHAIGVWANTDIRSVWSIVYIFSFGLWPAVTGWVVSRTHRARQAAMVLAYVAVSAIHTIWHLVTTYNEIKFMPHQTEFTVAIFLSCFTLLSTLIGGFLHKPALRSQN